VVKVNRLLLLLLISGLVILPATAMVIEEPMEGVLTAPSIFELKAISYTDATTFIERTVMKFSELLGLQPETTTETISEIKVEVDGQVIAVIPTDSKFNGVQVHGYCLQYQYGTSLWYECEQGLLV
jgi:hypothetical protein